MYINLFFTYIKAVNICIFDTSKTLTISKNSIKRHRRTKKKDLVRR